VNSFGNHFFARACFTVNEKWGLGIGCSLNDVQLLQHRGIGCQYSMIAVACNANSLAEALWLF